MTASINFTVFTSETVLFASKAAANQFFNGLTVADATETVDGVVKRAENVAVVPAQSYVNIPIIDGEGNVGTTQVVDKASFDALKAAFDALLLTLKAKGQMTSD